MFGSGIRRKQGRIPTVDFGLERLLSDARLPPTNQRDMVEILSYKWENKNVQVMLGAGSYRLDVSCTEQMSPDAVSYTEP